MGTLYSVDRLENGLAVLIGDDDDQHLVPLDQLPDGVGEGTVLIRTEDGYCVDEETARQRREKALTLLKKLRKKNEN